MTTKTKRKTSAVSAASVVAADQDLLKGLMREALEEIVDGEMIEAIGAALGERSPGRVGYRARYYSRGLVTRIGKLELRVPDDRDGRFSTQLFERYQRSEKALVSALAEMYVQGVSTRKLKAITEELCGHTFSASAISQINKKARCLAEEVRPAKARRAISLPDSGCPLREGPDRRLDPVSGGADRHRHRLGGAPQRPGRCTGQP